VIFSSGIGVVISEENVDNEIGDELDLRILTSVSSALKMEIAYSLEILVYVYQTAQYRVSKIEGLNQQPSDFNYTKKIIQSFLFERSFMKYNGHVFVLKVFLVRPPLWSSGQSSWLQIRRPGFDSRHYKKKKVVVLERGPLSLVSTTEELLDRKVAATV
jgi:hypothetical protein